jgi:nitrile hydratase subunit beta
MNGVHDMGGMHGFGPVPIERDEPVFHAEWERRVFGLSLALWQKMRSKGPQLRGAIEELPPETYLSVSYYEKWLRSKEALLEEAGLIDPAELEARTRHFMANPDEQPVRRDDPAQRRAMRERLDGRYPAQTDAAIEPAFAVGDAVSVRVFNPPGHTRVPRYIRGKAGTVQRFYGVHVFEDVGYGDVPPEQPIYSVRFEAAELWGDAVDGRGAVYLDLWESHIEPTGQANQQD